MPEPRTATFLIRLFTTYYLLILVPYRRIIATGIGAPVIKAIPDQNGVTSTDGTGRLHLMAHAFQLVSHCGVQGIPFSQYSVGKPLMMKPAGSLCLADIHIPIHHVQDRLKYRRDNCRASGASHHHE